jgi:predicted O-linked N-acetylglucosamine transferase (SPINDLY family)
MNPTDSRPVGKETTVNDANIYFQRALTLQQQGKYDEAVAYYQQSLRLEPNSASAYNNLGNVFMRQGKLSEAVESYQQALRCKPDSVDAHYNLGVVLAKQEKLDEAQAQYHEVLRLKPDHAGAYLNLGGVFKDQGRLDDALTAYRTALRIKPDAPDASLIHSNVVYTLNYHPGSDARTIQEECARWNQQHCEPLKQSIGPHANRPDPERRLRIGYVSPDFRDHVDSFFTIPLLSNHNRRHFAVCCYAHMAWPDAVTERLRGYTEIWRSTIGLSDQQIAELVRRDQVDILVDLKVHTAHNRLLLFARKPAPVQVTWLGYPGTTGLSTIDYRLTDPYLDPPGQFDAFYSEESIRLPNTFWCYDPLTDQPPVNSLPALENGVVTFGCLNSFCKINDTCLTLWADVLREVPESRLLLRVPQGQTRERTLARLEELGIAEARVEFVDRVSRPEYLGLYHRIDVGLDPLPYNGHTTSLDAFWMGVPTLTLVGKTVVGRAGLSQLCNLGLPELAVEGPSQYVALGAGLARDLPRLQELRRTLRQRMRQSPLMDGKSFALEVEKGYRQIWRRWCLEKTSAFWEAFGRE